MMLEIIDISEIFELLEISKIMKTSESDRVDPSVTVTSKAIQGFDKDILLNTS